MKTLSVLSLLSLLSCNALNPAIFQAADDVLTNQQLEISCDKDVFAGEKQVRITIEVTSPEAG